MWEGCSSDDDDDDDDVITFSADDVDAIRSSGMR